MRLLPEKCRRALRCPVRISTVCVCAPRHRESLPEAKMTGPNKTDTELDATRQRLRRYARLLDSGIGVPGTRWQIGIEALIGLIPGVGDLAGALLGGRSAERRVGTACVSTCRYRWSPSHTNKTRSSTT